MREFFVPVLGAEAEVTWGITGAVGEEVKQGPPNDTRKSGFDRKASLVQI